MRGTKYINLRCIVQNFYLLFLRYDTPDDPFFLQKIFFGRFHTVGSNYGAKRCFYLWSSLVSIECQNEPKSICQPYKNLQKFKVHEIIAKIILDSGNVWFLWFENYKCQFFHFLGTSENATLAQNVDHKGAFLGPNQGSIAKKSYKDSQKGVKSCCRPLHEPRLKAFFSKMGHRNFARYTEIN